MLRLLALPVFVYLIATQAWGAALVMLFGMAASDIVDGYLARRLDQMTRLGAVLDPFADRATIVVVSLTLLIAGVVPAFLAALILIRDVLLTAMVVLVFRNRLPIPITKTAKIATAVLLFGIPTLLLGRPPGPGPAAIHTAALLVVTAGVVLYYVALFQYATAGLRAHRSVSMTGSGGPVS